MRKMFTILTALCLVLQSAFGQTVTFRGKALDDQGATIPFVSVKIKGTKGGVVADAEGVFTIKAKAGDVLIITSAGYETKQATVPVDAKVISVVLVKTSQELSTVVVTALGIKREARSLGYATAQIDNKDLVSSAPVNMASGITGKVSGMEIATVNSGVDPDNIRITLRGNRSFLGNNEPLLVVDGIPTDISYLAQVSPADIASVNVLKGATAAALYGSQAANGVMIVTTRQGARRPTVTVSSVFTMDKVSFFPKMQYFGGSASSEYTATDQLSYANPSTGQNGYVPFENQSFGAPYALGSPFGGDSVILGAAGPDGQVQLVPYKPLVNEIKDFWNTGKTYQNGVSYAQGDENSSIYLSGENVQRSGITPQDQFNRTTVRFNGSKRYGAFKATGNVSYGESNQNVEGNPFQMYYQVQNIATDVPFASYTNTNAVFGDINTYYNAYALNPYWYVQNNRHTQNRQDLVASADLSLDATKWMTLDYQLGVSNYAYYDQYTIAALNFSAYSFYMQGATLSANESYFVGNSLPQVSTDNYTDRRLYSNFKIILHKNVGDFGGQLILGNNINQEKYNYLQNGSTTLLNIGGFYNVNYREGTPSVGQQYTLGRNFGNYADLTLNYKNWIFLHGSGRQDQNSVLAENNRSYFYPGMDASVVLSDAINSIKSSKVISFLKIRGGESKTGNVSIGPYAIQNTVNAAPGFPFGSTAGLTTSYTLPNYDLKPEFTTSSEVGFDVGFWKNRIDLQGNYFSEKTTNETVTIGTSAATGYQNYLNNIGSMVNSGEELDLRANVLKLKNGLSWDVGVHFTHYKNIVKSLGGATSLSIPTSGPGGSNSFAVVGNAYPTLLLSDWQKDPAGQVIVNPNTGLPQQSPNLENFGPANPTNTLGLTTSVSFKGFTLSAVGEYRGGNMIYNGTGLFLDVDGLSARSAMFGHSRFVYPNSAISLGNGKYQTNTNITVNDGGVGFWGNFGYFPNSMFVTSAAFWTLRNMSLSYQVPRKVLQHLKVVQGITIGVVGSNLLLFVPKSNQWTNPEFSEDTGNSTGTNSINEPPPTRTFGANLTVVF
jgi:TonB-linked SusC/RagA family outer membrane protein